MTIVLIQVPCDSVFLVVFFKAIYNKTIIKLGFCDILNNQGISLIIPDITKTSSTIFFFFFFQSRCAPVRSDTNQIALHSVQFTNH